MLVGARRRQTYHGLGPVQCLDRSLLVHAQDQGCLGRVEVEAGDVPDFLDEQRGELEGVDTVWLRAEGLPDPEDGGLRHPGRGHRSYRPLNREQAAVPARTLRGAVSAYVRVFELRELRLLIPTSGLSSLGTQLWRLALVLFTLERLHSATLAGVVVAASIVPGLVLSPVAGALLDRYGHRRLVALDWALSAAAPLAIVGANWLGRLPAAELIAIVAFNSATSSFGNSGIRALMTRLVPRTAWPRMNAVDSANAQVLSVVGPAVAGVLVTLRGPETALLATSATYAVAVALVLALPRGGPAGDRRGSLLAETAGGLRYVLATPTLRGLAVSSAVQGVGRGILQVAVPVLVLQRLGGSAAAVGALWAVQSLASLAALLVMGHLIDRFSRRALFAGGLAAIAVTTAALAVAPSVPVVGALMALTGLLNAPVGLSVLQLRQEVTDPRLHGRAFAISAALNGSGSPVGAAVSGALIAVSLTLAVAVAALMPALAAALAVLILPPAERQ
jgi:MFS family permease